MTSTRPSIYVSILVASLVSGCGDNLGVAPADAQVAPPSGSTAFVVSGDFMGTGIASTVSVPSLRVTTNVIAGVASDDPVVRYHDGRLYIINRFNHDNIVILDAADLALVAQLSTGPGSNPQDVAVRGTTLYVAALAAPGILVMDADEPSRGVIATIDLSGLDPVDGIPDCKSVLVVGDRLIATCAILDDFAPTGPGKVVVIDTRDNSVETTLDLATRNPVGTLLATPADSAFGGDLITATVDFGVGLTVGCVERIGLTPLASKGCLIDNAALAGYATGYAYGPGDKLYVAATTGFGPNGQAAQVRSYDAVEQTLSDAPITAAGHNVFDLALCPTGEWVAADSAGGIRVYGPDDTELTADLLDIGLPPIGGGLVCYQLGDPP